MNELTKLRKDRDKLRLMQEAAPNMLAALKATTEALAQSYIEATAADADPRVIAGRAAIAKAEGR